MLYSDRGFFGDSEHEQTHQSGRHEHPDHIIVYKSYYDVKFISDFSTEGQSHVFFREYDQSRIILSYRYPYYRSHCDRVTKTLGYMEKSRQP